MSADPAARPSDTRTLSEADSKELLAPYGVPFPREQVVSSADAAADAATAIGFPVVAKGANEVAPASAIDFHLAITQTGRAVGFTYDPIGSANSNGIRGASSIALSQWVMIGVTLDASTATRQVWLDGKVDVSTAPPAAPTLGTNTHFVVGGSNKTNGTGAGRFKGDVAVVLVYDRALAQDEIRASCHSYSSRFETKACPP